MKMSLQQSPAGPDVRVPRSCRPAQRVKSVPRGLWIGLVVSAFSVFLLLAGTAHAYAATFDPTLVVSDDTMRAAGSMNESDIQAFLNAQTGMLKGYTDVSYGVVPGVPGPVEPASRIIFEAAQYYNISPKILLSLLQKEQSLLTRTTLAPNTLARAVGAGCPNSTTNKYPGFGNQIWNGARLLGGYGEGTNGTGSYVPYVGGSGSMSWGPGQSNKYTGGVAPQSLATYKLYVYNPSIGARAPYGDLSGQSCSGNANFWKIYWKYFGDPFGNPRLRQVYRFYNFKTGTHFYTISEAERYTVFRWYANTYRFEGAQFAINTSSTANTSPLYRFYNTRTGTHFYTASWDEAQSIPRNWPNVFKAEGVAFNISTTAGSGAPVYRFYNMRAGGHFYTSSEAERQAIIAKWPTIYRPEGVAYYLGN